MADGFESREKGPDMDNSHGSNGGQAETVKTVRIAHVSDPHLICLDGLRAAQLLGKRVIGYLNIVLNRSKIHKPALAFRVFEEVRAHGPDHVIVTGDLGNLALEGEYQFIRQWLDTLEMSPDRVTVVPGNHDAYVSSAVRDGHMARILGPYLTSSPEYPLPSGSREAIFPVVRLDGKLMIIGCCSAVPSPPFMAWGKLGGVQLARLEGLLRAGEQLGVFRIVAVHHPVQPSVTRVDNGLVDRASVHRVLVRAGAELVLHGHMHRPMETLLAGPRSTPIRVLGIGSASLDSALRSMRAQFRLIDVREGEFVGSRVYAHDPVEDRFVPLPETNPSGSGDRRRSGKPF